MLKKLIIALGLAAVIASPAFAQSYDPSVGSGNLVAPPTAAYGGPVGPSGRADIAGRSNSGSGTGAYAFAPFGAEQPMTTGSVRSPRYRHYR